MEDNSWDRSSEEEIFRFYTRTRAPETKDRIIKRYMPLVGPVVRKYGLIGESHEDLAQVGYVGLLKALESFDPDRNVRFSTYATHCIMGEVRHYLRDRAETIRKPRWLKKLSSQASEYIDNTLQEKKRLPTVDELSDELGISGEEAVEILNFKNLVSLDEDIMTSKGDTIDRASALKSEISSTDLEDRIVLEQAIDELKAKEKKIVYFFFYMDLTQTQIAKKIGISQKKVSRMLKKALKKLRDILSKDVW
ncbi:MAG: sigma-70 family RNA polymerase sigma factor [Candidatus Eremiobacteraeota bacterium]|nr:sigma-70 family RNA polymerase sigma factor [Candidatus Eremiobacteraeota bacterium]